MVEIVDVRLLSDAGPDRGSRAFPERALSGILSAVESVPDGALEGTELGEESSEFDAALARDLPGYRTEDSGGCRLWQDEGFRHSVDLYHPGERIAIEVEKSEQKYVWRDLVKFARGGTTGDGDRTKVEFGCLIVPVNYRGSRDVFAVATKTLEFMRPLLPVEDVAVVGYRIPGWE